MARKSSDQAAAQAVSDAARALAQHQHAQRAESPVEPAGEPVEVKSAPSQPIERGNKIREATMEEIRKTRGEDKIEPPKAAEPKLEPPTEPAAPPAEVAPTPPEVAPVVAADPVETPPETTIETVRVKVDGEEFDAPKADVEAAGGIRAYQQERAAENRLKKTNEALAETRRLLATMQQQQRPPAPPPVSDADFIKSKLDTIRFGTPEEGAAAWQEIQSRSRIDPNAVIQQATAQFEHQMAVKEFDRDFADLGKIPDAMDLVIIKRQRAIQKAQQEGRAIDWTTTYRTIGTEVRNAFGRQSQPAPQSQAAPNGTPSPSTPDKNALKASLTVVPTAASRAALPAEEKAETREESLARMKKARGQLY